MGYRPEGWHTVTARIATADPAAVVEFMRDVFGAEGEYTPGRPADVTIGDSRILVGDDQVRGAIPAFLYVYVPDADAVYRRAIAAGATANETPFDTPYGDRRAMVTDAWGNIWQIATTAD